MDNTGDRQQVLGAQFAHGLGPWAQKATDLRSDRSHATHSYYRYSKTFRNYFHTMIYWIKIKLYPIWSGIDPCSI